MPLAAILLSSLLPAKPTSQNSEGQHELFAHFTQEPNCEVCRRPKPTRAPRTRILDDRAKRIKIAKRLFGDVITVDHKARNEEQES